MQQGGVLDCWQHSVNADLRQTEMREALKSRQTTIKNNSR